MGSGGLGERNRDFHEDPFQEEMVLAWKRPCMPCSLLHPSLHPHGSRGIVQESLSALEGVGFFGRCCLIHNSNTNNKPGVCEGEEASPGSSLPSRIGNAPREAAACTRKEFWWKKCKFGVQWSCCFRAVVAVGWCWWARTGKLNLESGKLHQHQTGPRRDVWLCWDRRLSQIGARQQRNFPQTQTFSRFAPGLCPTCKYLPLDLFSLIPPSRMPLFQWQAQPRRHPARKLTVRVRSGNNQRPHGNASPFSLPQRQQGESPVLQGSPGILQGSGGIRCWSSPAPSAASRSSSLGLGFGVLGLGFSSLGSGFWHFGAWILLGLGSGFLAFGGLDFGILGSKVVLFWGLDFVGFGAWVLVV